MADWPLGLCSEDEGHSSIELPFVVDGETIFTDGRVLVALPGEGEGYDLGSGPSDNVVRNVLATPVVDARRWPLSELRERCGPAVEVCPDCTPEEREAVCKKCDGLGSVDCQCGCGHEHDKDCPECRGEGALSCETCDNEGVVLSAKPARLGESIVNLRLLAKLLDGAPGEFVEIGTRDDHPERALPIVGDGWRGAIMPMRSFGNPNDFPSLDVPAEATP